MSTQLIVFAHVGEALRPHDLWAAWTFEPVTVVGLALMGGLYARGCANLWRTAGDGRGIRRGEAWTFAAGWVILALSLVSPLHALGGSLFSAHMTQHEFLMTVAAPLIVLGRPLVPFVWGLSPGWRRTTGRWAGARPVAGVWHAITHPFAVFLIHGAAIWVWHVPALYDASVRNEAFHAAQHISFFATALLFWWVTLHPSSARGGTAASIASLFATMLHTSVLGALLALSSSLVYTVYGATTAPWGLTPLEDQQLGGLIMWVPGGIAYIAAALAMVLRALRESEARVVSRERRDAAAIAGAPRMSSLLPAIVLLLVLAGCDGSARRTHEAAVLTGGDPERGRSAIREYGCGSCHSIPGVLGANSLVGPPLGGVAQRAYIAGVLPNTPENLVRWIRAPREVDPKTAMPNMGVGVRDARDIAGYLYSIQ